VDAARRAREAAEASAAEEAAKHDEADSFAKWSAKHGTVSDEEVRKVAHKDFAAWASEHNVDTSPLPSAAGRKSHHDAHEEFKRQYWAAKEQREHAARVAARQAAGDAAADGAAGSFDVKEDGSDLEFKAPGAAALSQLSAVGAPKAAPLQHKAAVGGGDGSFVSRLERRVAAMPAVPDSVLCRLSFWGVRPLCPAGTSPA
jgi:hypothetical protein